MLNKTLLRKVRNRILAKPEAYDQKTWGRGSRLAPCGTACCIAGHALIEAGAATPKELRLSKYANGTALYAQDEAARVLGLDWNEPAILFTGDPAGGVWATAWPEPFCTRWRAAKTKERRARVAADYINHILKTGKVTE